MDFGSSLQRRDLCQVTPHPQEPRSFWHPCHMYFINEENHLCQLCLDRLATSCPDSGLFVGMYGPMGITVQVSGSIQYTHYAHLKSGRGRRDTCDDHQDLGTHQIAQCPVAKKNNEEKNISLELWIDSCKCHYLLRKKQSFSSGYSSPANTWPLHADLQVPSAVFPCVSRILRGTWLCFTTALSRKEEWKPQS